MSTTRVISLLQRASVWGGDCLSLAQSLHQSWRIRPKPVTLLLADHQDNQVARSLLRWHKEYNLLRYYGFRGYYLERRRRRISAPSERDAGRTQTTAAPSSSSTVARISFMVTARMKEELKDLGYSAESIAKLKPLEASLVLQNKLRDATPEQLMEVVQLHEAQLVLDQELRAAESSRADRQAGTVEVQSTASFAPQGLSRLQNSSPRDSSLFAAYASRNELLVGTSQASLTPSGTTTNSSKPRVWFELVERGHQQHDQAQETVVGLFLSQTEAQESLETHRFFARRNGRDGVEFDIRQTTR